MRPHANGEMSEPGHVDGAAAAGTMQVAVIIPAYNSAHFLRRCIDSVLAQTFPATEVVVVDDGSSDNTREVVAAYAAPVRYHWQPNGGLSAARNAGVRVTESC